MHPKIIVAATVAVSGIFAAALPAHAVAYTFTTVDVPGATSTIANGINDAGQIVGGFSDSTGGHGFLYTGGSFTTLPGGFDYHGINDAGQIVGSTFVQQTRVGFVLDTDGTITTFSVPNFGRTFAFGINDVGQIVGQVNNLPFHGFLRDIDG